MLGNLHFCWAVVGLVAFTFLPNIYASRCYFNFSPDDYPYCKEVSVNVSLHWAVRNGLITWAVDVDGVWDWIGLGISEGGMLGADIAVVAHDLKAQQWTAGDYWSAGFSMPKLDKQQDVSLVSVAKQSGSTRVAMRRPLVTCDAGGEDRAILNDTRQTVIFAYGTGSFSYHGASNRGEYDLVFLANNTTGAAAGGPKPPLQTLELRMTPGFVVPSDLTTYQCVNLALPNDTKYHLYSWQPLIDNRPLVHHFLAYSCRGTAPPPTQLGVPYDCISNMECEEYFIGWAPGINSVESPPLAALAFGAGTGILYLALQIHYSNPLGLTGKTDTSGFRLSYSSTLKKYDMGVLTLGSYDIAVPPGALAWSTAPNVCPGACTTQLAAGAAAALAGGVTLVDSGYHMHQLGRAAVTRHVRNGVELPPLGRRDYFDFAYQGYVSIPPSTRQLLPGDFLITTCTYTGQGRSNVTRFGPSSWDEMCFNFMTYYPYNAAVGECIQLGNSSWAACTTSDELQGLKGDADWQAAAQAGKLVQVPANVTFKPYQPVCTPTAPIGAGGPVPRPTYGGDGDGDDDDDDDDDDEVSPAQHHHHRNVGGAVAAILVVTLAGAVAIVVVYKVMKKKQQAEDEKHLFEKYNPSVLALPVASYGAAATSSSADPTGKAAGNSTPAPAAAGSGSPAIGLPSLGGLGKGYKAVPSDV